MSEDPITAVANAVAEAEHLLEQPLTSGELSTPQREYIDRIKQFETIMANPNEATRGIQLGAWTQQLLIDAGSPSGLLSGRTIRVPLEHFTAFIQTVGQLIELREQVTANTAQTSVTH